MVAAIAAVTLKETSVVLWTAPDGPMEAIVAMMWSTSEMSMDCNVSSKALDSSGTFGIYKTLNGRCRGKKEHVLEVTYDGVVLGLKIGRRLSPYIVAFLR